MHVVDEMKLTSLTQLPLNVRTYCKVLTSKLTTNTDIKKLAVFYFTVNCPSGIMTSFVGYISITLARNSLDVVYHPCMVRRMMVTGGGDTMQPS